MSLKLCEGGCGKMIETVTFCLPVRTPLCMEPPCMAVWEAANPGVWIDASETLPGGRYDGVWENNGFGLEGAR